MGNRVEVTAQVRVDDLDVTLLRRSVNLIDRLVRTPLGQKSKGERIEIRFPDRHQ
jgi:hypothetical protein